jgi:hypothetical protein
MRASRFWYVGMYVPARSRFVKKSTRCKRLIDAKDFAKDWCKERVLERINNKVIEEQSFATFVQWSQTTQKRQISRGELVEEMLYNDKLKLDNDLLPYLGHIHVSKIDYNLVDNFIAELHAEKGLSQSSLKKYVVLVRKVLKDAERDGTIDHIPALPAIKRTENPRPWFSPEQYAALLEKCRLLRDNPPERTEFDFGELYDFIVFMVHSFLRPSEWKLLQHKHIRVFNDDGVEQLVISFPNSKTKNANGIIESTTTEVAADLYLKKILPRHDGKNDYLFFNDIQDWTYAGDKVSKMFKYLVKSAGLDTDAYGHAHTTYPLRHSSLCFQILKTGGNDLFGLAKNARTSVLMLEKLYLKHLTPQMPEFIRQLSTKRFFEVSKGAKGALPHKQRTSSVSRKAQQTSFEF